jgi:hypothetical protein
MWPWRRRADRNESPSVPMSSETGLLLNQRARDAAAAALGEPVEAATRCQHANFELACTSLPPIFLFAVTRNQVHVLRELHDGTHFVGAAVVRSWDRAGFQTKLLHEQGKACDGYGRQPTGVLSDVAARCFQRRFEPTGPRRHGYSGGPDGHRHTATRRVPAFRSSPPPSAFRSSNRSAQAARSLRPSTRASASRSSLTYDGPYAFAMSGESNHLE